MRNPGGTLVAVLVLVSAAACSATSLDVGGDGGADATTSPTPTTSPSPTASPSQPPPARPDAGPVDDGGPIDASATDASSDAPTDASVDAADASIGPVRLGADGVLRGAVTSVTYEHRWNGALRAGNASCPANATIVDGGGIMCCVWSRAFGATQVVNVPVTFDLATRTGTLAGAPIGIYSGPTPPDANGTVEYLINPSSNHRAKAWEASNAIAELMGESATLVAESRAFPALNLVYEVIMSLSAARVSWNATTSTFRIYETHPLVSIPTGRCGNQSSGGRLAYDLRSP